MQRSSQQAIISSFGDKKDTILWVIKEKLESSYWLSDEGVFEFQFISGNIPLTNITSPHYFQLMRYTSDNKYEAFMLNIPGRLNNDGSFVYGGGRMGYLEISGNAIKWDDGKVWTKVNKVNKPPVDYLDLGRIQKQAQVDSKSMGVLVQTNYYYNKPISKEPNWK